MANARLCSVWDGVVSVSNAAACGTTRECGFCSKKPAQELSMVFFLACVFEVILDFDGPISDQTCGILSPLLHKHARGRGEETKAPGGTGHKTCESRVTHGFADLATLQRCSGLLRQCSASA